MKKLIYSTLIALTVLACKKERNDFVTFSGKITNKNSDSLIVSNPQFQFKRVIKVDENGAFKDTMNIKTGFYSIFDGKEYTTAYLKNGDNISMSIDTKEFDETVSFSGEGAGESNFLAKSTLNQEAFFTGKDIFSLNEADFKAKIKNFVDEYNNRLVAGKDFDSLFVASQKANIQNMEMYFNKMYDDKKYIKNTLAKGNLSPKFVDYENFKGGKTSLDDLKGKYVYIDMWATWCQPCKAEIPFLQKVEKQYHNKNIEFVSISTDDKRDYETWKKMVTDMKLTGVQLFSNRDEVFSKAYRVNSIPRFILLDPQGNIVDANAPRPSSPKLIELFDSLKI